MTSLHRQQTIPITIEKSSDPLRFDECNITTDQNLLSLCDSGQSTMYTTASLNAICVKQDQKESERKRHSIGGECYHEEKSTQLHEHSIYKAKDDSDTITAKVNDRGTKLSRSLTCLISKFRSSQNSQEPKLRIKVEYIDCKSTEKLWPYTDSTDNEDMLDFPDHNYSPSLVITDLSDGCFSAQIPLKVLPQGDLTIRIRNYKMEIVVGRRPSLVADNHRVIYPIRYGDIDIPIYVNPSSLWFDVDETEKTLFMHGYTKGSHAARKSSFSSQRKKKLSLPSPSLGLKYHSDISLLDGNGDLPVQNRSPKRSLTVSYSSVESF